MNRVKNTTRGLNIVKKYYSADLQYKRIYDNMDEALKIEIANYNIDTFILKHYLNDLEDMSKIKKSLDCLEKDIPYITNLLNSMPSDMDIIDSELIKSYYSKYLNNKIEYADFIANRYKNISHISKNLCSPANIIKLTGKEFKLLLMMSIIKKPLTIPSLEVVLNYSISLKTLRKLIKSLLNGKLLKVRYENNNYLYSLKEIEDEFIEAPSQLVNNRLVTPFDIKVYLTIQYHNGNISNEEIGQYIQADAGNISRSIKRLIKANFLKSK